MLSVSIRYSGESDVLFFVEYFAQFLVGACLIVVRLSIPSPLHTPADVKFSSVLGIFDPGDRDVTVASVEARRCVR